MKKLAELRQERAAKVKAQSDLLNEVRTAKREFSEEEETRFDGFTTEIEDLDKQIERAVKIDEAEKRAAGLNGTPVDTSVSDGEGREAEEIKSRASVARAMRLAAKNQVLDGAEKEMSELGELENRQAEVKGSETPQFYIPMSMLRADAFTATEDAGAYGGKTIVKQAPQLQMPFAANPIMAQLGATIWSGLSGGAIPLPVGGKSAFSWLTETGETPLGKAAIDGPELDPRRLGRTEDISNRLILQSSVNIEGFIRAEIIKAFYRAIDEAAVNGSGTAPEPTGILNTAGIQLSSTTAAAAATRAMINELPALLAAEDVSEDALAFLLSPELRRILQDKKVDAGSGQFLMNSRNELGGYKAVVSTMVPQLTGNNVLLFGDFSKLFIGLWGSLGVTTDPYSASRKNSLRITVNGHAGTAIAQPKAFAVNKFVIE